jgi:hypothetical protein
MYVTIKNLPNGIAPLFRHYPRQAEPQPAFLSLDLESGEVSADFDGEIGNAVPARVFAGMVRRYMAPAAIRGEALRPLVESLLPLLERVYLESDVQVCNDGQRIVTLYEDAASAEAELSEIEHDEASCWNVRSPDDWLDSVPAADLVRAGESIEAAEERIESGALADGVYLDGDVEAYLRERLAL